MCSVAFFTIDTVKTHCLLAVNTIYLAAAALRPLMQSMSPHEHSLGIQPQEVCILQAESALHVLLTAYVLHRAPANGAGTAAGAAAAAAAAAAAGTVVSVCMLGQCVCVRVSVLCLCCVCVCFGYGFTVDRYVFGFARTTDKARRAQRLLVLSLHTCTY